MSISTDASITDSTEALSTSRSFLSTDNETTSYSSSTDRTIKDEKFDEFVTFPNVRLCFNLKIKYWILHSLTTKA